MKYEVQHYTICDGWINTWLVCDEDNNEIPQVFDTKEEAQAELDEFLMDIQEEIKAGERKADEGYSADEFRITPLLHKNEEQE